MGLYERLGLGATPPLNLQCTLNRLQNQHSRRTYEFTGVLIITPLRVELSEIITLL